MKVEAGVPERPGVHKPTDEYVSEEGAPFTWRTRRRP